MTIKHRRMRATERDKYVAYVMWLIGFSETSIAVVLGRRRKQVAGMIVASEYSNRSAMGDDRRQEKLTELSMIRFDDSGQPLDGGLLDRIPFRIKPLTGKQLRRPVRRSSS